MENSVKGGLLAIPTPHVVQESGVEFPLVPFRASRIRPPKIERVPGTKIVEEEFVAALRMQSTRGRKMNRGFAPGGLI